jgi:hypothetical protein
MDEIIWFPRASVGTQSGRICPVYSTLARRNWVPTLARGNQKKGFDFSGLKKNPCSGQRCHLSFLILNREISVTTQIEMINHLKSERLNQRLLQAVKESKIYLGRGGTI